MRASLVSSLVAVAILVWLGSYVKWEFVRELEFDVLWKYRWALLQGFVNTLLITGVSVAIGSVAGLFLAIGHRFGPAPLRWLITLYVEVLRNTPLLVQLFWIHFAMPFFTGISTSAFQSGFLAMSLQSSAYLADLARAGIQAVPRGQWEAAHALGLPAWPKWTRIVLPQAIRIIIPPLANIAIGYFKASAALALLQVGELMTVASRVAYHSFKPIETFTVVGLIYLVLGYGLASLTWRLETLLGRSAR